MIFARAARLKLLFAAMADKEWGLMLRALAKAVDEIIFTRVAMERSADPEHWPSHSRPEFRAARSTTLGSRCGPSSMEPR